MSLFIAIAIKGVHQYIKFTIEEQDDDKFELEFVDKLIGKGKKTCFKVMQHIFNQLFLLNSFWCPQNSIDGKGYYWYFR